MSEHREFKLKPYKQDARGFTWIAHTDFESNFEDCLGIVVIEKHAYEELQEKHNRTNIALQMCRDAYDILNEDE